MITNAGWKAVAITPATRQNWPGSLTVSNLTISAPQDSWSTLLLDYSGSEVPLHLLGNLSVGPNARLASFYGGLALEPSRRCWITNAELVVFEGALTMSNAVTRIDASTCTLQDADTRWGELILGGFGPVTFSQTGGRTSADRLDLSGAPWEYNGAEVTFNLTNGTLLAGNMELGVKETTTFNQVESSVVAGSIDCGYRAYASHVQHGGELVSGILSIGTFGSGYGSFQQFGGSNSIGSLKIGNGTVFYGGYCYYQMCDGTLSSGEVQIGRGGYGGWFTQSGGLHTISGGLSLLGTVYITVPYSCGYTISNGTLHAASLTMSIASFTHLNSTTRFDGPVEIPGGWTRYSPATFFTVSGGLLSCSNFTSSDAELTVSAGTLLVSNTLSFSGAAYFSSSRDSMAGFEFSGDCLAARDMVINARMVVLDSSQAGRIQNPGKFTLGGWLRFGRADEQLGTLVVDKRFWDPEITFTASSAKLRFLSSAAEAWPCTRLSVSGWNGVPAGGQGTQLFVGTNRYGLTPTQLHGIRFVNPAGLAPGVYNAVILDTGEVVPTIRPFIESKAIDGALVLSWPTNCILQSATNVTGPYADWPQVVSPYTNSTLEGLSQFFRLRLR